MTTAILERPSMLERTGNKDDIQYFIEEKLSAFDAAIEGHEFLEIDGDLPGNTPKEDCLKIINHKLESAYAIDIDSVIRQDLESVIHALETGIFMLCMCSCFIIEAAVRFFVDDLVFLSLNGLGLRD